MSYTYGARNDPLLSQTYGNGDVVRFTYDALGRTKTTAYSDGRVLTYTYTGDGQVYTIQDSLTGFTYRYSYDVLGRVIASTLLDGTTVLLETRQTYNANCQLSSQVFRIGSTSYTETYTYHAQDGTLTGLKTGLGDTLTIVYDKLKRIQKLDLSGLDRNYTYRDISSTQTTTQVTKLWYGPTESSAPYAYSYSYDAVGNIATYTENGTAYTYTYDSQNQLLSASGGGKTYTYTYDTVGNLLTASDRTTTHTYTYGDSTWRDKLTAYDGQSITYDASGNPLTYYNGQSYAFTWKNGRQLATATVNGTTYSFTYDGNGLRHTKNVGGTLHTYYYAGDRLVRETYGSNTLDFFYDTSDRPYALKYNGTTYYYILNLQGDVMALVDSSGTQVAAYTYDPWGKILTATGTMANTNPLRYRGYYYDTDTGFYYLQSRYYDPMLGRFLNADGYASTGQGILGHNMFAYCGNSPMNFIDPTGTCWKIFGIVFDCNKETCPTSKKFYLNAANVNAANLRDVSDEIDLALSKQDSIFESKFPSESTCGNERFGLMINIDKLYTFYNLVNHEMPWDIKRPDPWENTIETQYPGWEEIVIYHNIPMTPQTLGNYCYGHLGRTLGIPLDVLYAGSYYAADFPIWGEEYNNECNFDWYYIELGYYGIE